MSLPSHVSASSVRSLKLGELLVKAHLISSHQLQTALLEQSLNPHRRLGEILADHGWIQQKTADFFADKWPNLREESTLAKKRLGEYLIEAGLLSPEQIQEIMAEQQDNRLWRRFGAIVAFKGWIPISTIDLFLEYLFPEYADDSPFTKPRDV